MPTPTKLYTCRLDLYTTDNGGLSGPMSGKYAKMPAKLHGVFNDIIIFLSEGMILAPGGSYELPVAFIWEHELASSLNVGTQFELWPNVRHCGDGQIVRFEDVTFPID
ncbi:MAG: hypothetical protein K1X53_18095 [Candidatus Sumerlaeaceae bacterium]|nr:hypothetical protein [Candidatus Sumerlaeaceae bacterium]